MDHLPVNTTRCRKSGAEDVILMRLHADRFRKLVPPHLFPPVDKRSRCHVAMVIQSCLRNSYDDHEAGHSFEFHLWLRIEAMYPDKTKQAGSNKLPVQSWLSLTSASGNPMARYYLQSFGFRPLLLEKVEFQKNGGKVIFQEHEQINWTFNGRGLEFRRVDLDHVLNMAIDGSDSAGHHIHASISDPVMDQPGRVNILTNLCEPFLHRGDRFAAVVHRMSGLEANIEWRKEKKMLL